MTEHEQKSRKEKTSRELGIEIKRSEVKIDEFVRERTEAIKLANQQAKILKVKNKETLERAKEVVQELRRDAIERTGRMYEQEFVSKGLLQMNQISGQLMRHYKGVISPSWIGYVINDINRKWKKSSRGGMSAEDFKKNKRTSPDTPGAAGVSGEDLTTVQKQTLAAHLDAYQGAKIANELLKWLLGKDVAQIQDLESRIKQGQTRKQAILEACEDHIFKKSKQMTESALKIAVSDLGLIAYVSDRIAIRFYEELERRKDKTLTGV